MKNNFIPYELAKKFKRMGFREECLAYYDGNKNLQYMYNGKPENFTDKRMGVSDSLSVGWTSAPLFQQAFKWLREKYNLLGFVDSEYVGNFYFMITEITDEETLLCEKEFSTHEEAELACLNKVIELRKEQESDV